MNNGRIRLFGSGGGVFAVCALAAGLALTGCGVDQSPAVPATPTGDNSVSITFPAPSGTQLPQTDQITPAVAKQLCDMIGAEIGDWEDRGVVLGRVAFNGTVHNWALRNGGLNDTVLADRSVIDAATTPQCPDVRARALTALDIPDLASGLAGF